VHSQLCVSADGALIARMLLDVHHHMCNRDGISDSDFDAYVDKVYCLPERLLSWQ